MDDTRAWSVKFALRQVCEACHLEQAEFKTDLARLPKGKIVGGAALGSHNTTVMRWTRKGLSTDATYSRGTTNAGDLTARNCARMVRPPRLLRRTEPTLAPSPFRGA